MLMLNNISNVSNAGQSHMLTVGSTSVGVDALIQVDALVTSDS